LVDYRGSFRVKLQKNCSSALFATSKREIKGLALQTALKRRNIDCRVYMVLKHIRDGQFKAALAVGSGSQCRRINIVAKAYNHTLYTETHVAHQGIAGA